MGGGIKAAVDFRTKFQRIHGFGYSQAFQRATLLRGDRGLSGAKRSEVLDLLMSPECGAGLTILRLGIGSSDCDVYDQMKSIQPESPGTPDATPKYIWDGDDGGQVWLARQAQRYGVKRFFAVAWSAPGFMKTNGKDVGGGTLLGLPETDRSRGDWRAAYANYLLQYVKFYRQEGIEITDISFMNEPELHVSYASMEFSAEQMIDMIKVIGPIIAESGLRLNLVCCEATEWALQMEWTKVIESDPDAARWVGVYSSHAYQGSDARRLLRDPDNALRHSILPSDKPAWMSEWVPDLGGPEWDENWDGTAASGFIVAHDVHRSLTLSNVSAYIYWLGASLGPSRSLIQLDGPNYRVSKRLWALASYSRFIRPGAVRVAASAADDDLLISAFENPDDSRVIVLLNTSESKICSEMAIEGSPDTVTSLDSYVTDSEHSLEPVRDADMSNGRLRVNVAPRSLMSIIVGHQG